nr:immunoglobulin heavy chain junction region [Macaca mulatta]MOX59915.1 immunoglobulin heavy chain junction region [Macaca mulatta]MOX60791.1 immunoglobulin heavy chain junction region [Macaca mulatta]MOX60928.1 immunoglobulin heavy chain junction region [Macaca mulatta]MOX60996.1 immunoglobulin heavy chain junction region [Macaca mulatta]
CVRDAYGSGWDSW